MHRDGFDLGKYPHLLILWLGRECPWLLGGRGWWKLRSYEIRISQVLTAEFP